MGLHRATRTRRPRVGNATEVLVDTDSCGGRSSVAVDRARGAAKRRRRGGASALPLRLLAQLRRYVAGRVIYVPVINRKRQNITRDRDIRRARAAGASIPDLARRFFLSESRIWEICRGLHPDRRPRRPE